jgi:phosphatidylglycerophosphatase A
MIALVLVVISIYFANNARENFGDSDPKHYILDEVAGQFITFFMVPFSWKTLLLGFFLFRFFDIIKPFPVHKLEELDEGLGVTMDDVAAGVLANVCLLATLGIYHGIRALL